ncbi:MAG: TIGR02996 domain-containing protein [Archangium sp.]
MRDVRPVTVPIVVCATCGHSSFDPEVLNAKRAAFERRPARMFFGAQPRFRMCLICEAAMLAPEVGGPVRCYRCDEEYDCLPLGGVKAKASMEALFTLIFERPDDDEPRQALADLLLEEGDSRGEFIRLQLEDARRPASAVRTSRMNELQLRDGWRWVPPGVKPERCAFHRGLLVRANFTSLTYPNHHGWRSVTQLEVTPSPQVPPHRRHGALGGPLQNTVQHIGRCSFPFVDWLREAPPPNLRRLDLSIDARDWQPSLVSRLAFVVNALRSVEELDVAAPVSLDWVAWTTQLIVTMRGRLKTLWLPMPTRLPDLLRRGPLPGFTVAEGHVVLSLAHADALVSVLSEQ